MNCFFKILIYFFLQNVVEEKDVVDDVFFKIVKYVSLFVMFIYLVVFVVGEFDFVEGKDVDGVFIRVYILKGKVIQGQFVLEVNELIIIIN